MKVAIYFFVENHYSFLKEILKQLPPDSKIDMYCSSFYYKLYKDEFKCRDLSFAKLFINSFKYDKIIIDEVYGRNILYLFLFIFKRNKVYLSIHNLKSWFQPEFFKGFKNFFNSFFRRIVVLLYRNFIVVGTGLKNYCETIQPNKDFYFIPFGLRNENDLPIKKKDDFLKKKLTIVIPGTIGSRRKYENIFKLLNDAEFRDFIEFIFLGAPEGPKGREILKEIKENYKNVIAYESFIPIEEFEKNLFKADFLLSDFEINYKTAVGQYEIYGITKETGISFLMARFEKIAILPADFKVMNELRSQVISFSDYKSLKSVIRRLCTMKWDEYFDLLRRAKKNKQKLIERIDEL